jgi:putative flippase GtrA
LSSGGAAEPSARSLPRLYQRFRQQVNEGAKFGIVGLTGVIIVLAGSDGLHFGLGLGRFTSVTIANVVATIVSLLGNRYWSFRDRQGGGARAETIMFFVLNGVGLLIQYACLALFTETLGLSGRLWYTLANLLGIAIGTLFRFWSYRKWIWVSPEVHLARLRRGRHRKGRDLVPVPARTPLAPLTPLTPPAVAVSPVPAPQLGELRLPLPQPTATAATMTGSAPNGPLIQPAANAAPAVRSAPTGGQVIDLSLRQGRAS